MECLNNRCLHRLLISPVTAAVLFLLGSLPLCAATINVPADHGTISAAVTAANPGDEIVVAPGTYNENVTVNKSLIIRSSGGRGVTTVNGSSAALGTFLIQADNVTIGGPGQGFTIRGYDNVDPAIEFAAIYVQGARNNLTIRGNELVADGEAGLLTEFGNAVNNLTVNANVFSGKTFTGSEAGDCGFTNQFSAANVPRQLVNIPTGSGVVFTSNSITGTAGSASSASGCTTTGQGNTLVTIDASNVSIWGNNFAGTTTRFGSHLRVRGVNVSIYCNTFNNAGLGSAATHITFNDGLTALTGGASPSTVAGVAAANTFISEGSYFTGATQIYRSSAQVTSLGQTPIAANTAALASVTNLQTGLTYCSIQAAIDDVNTLNTHVISIGAGTYAESINLNKSLTLRGPNQNVVPCVDTRLPEAVITGGLNIANGASLTVFIEGLLFQGVSSPLNYNGNVGAAALDATFRHNLVQSNSGQLAAFTGNATNFINLLVQYNCFMNMSGNAMQVGGLTGTVTAQILDNIINTTATAGINADGIFGSFIERNLISNTAQQAIQLAGPAYHVVIKSNVITNANTGSDANRGGIRLRGTNYAGPVHVLNNTISNALNAVIVPTGENITGKSIFVQENNLAGNTLAIKNAGTGTLQATCNWYGTTDALAIAALVSGSVTYSPFLVNGTDTDIPARGFQPVPNSCSGCSNQPRLQTTINGVVVTSNNDGTTDMGIINVCNNGMPNNIVINNFTELNGVSPTTNLRVYQTVTLTNATFPYCTNCQALLSAFTPGYSATLALVNPAMPGSAVVSFRLWNDDSPANGMLDNGECASDLIQYTINIYPLPSLQTTINTVQVTNNNDGADDANTLTVCHGSADNLFFTQFADMTGATPAANVKVIQQFARTNVTFGPGDGVFPLSAYTPAFSRNVALVNTAMSGTLVMRFRIFYDANNNNMPDAGECANDWVQYTVTVNIGSGFSACPVGPLVVSTTPGLCTAPVTYVATASGVPAPAVTYQFTGATTGSGSGTGSGSIFAKGTTNVQLTAVNACGTVLCSFTVVVNDNEPPTLNNCPANLTLKTNDDGGADCAVTLSYVPPTFSDNCDGTGPATLLSGPASGTSLNTSGSPYTVVYTKTDLAGNPVLTNCTFTVTVQDDTKPLITCPGSLTVSNDAGQCGAIVTYPMPVASDNCQMMGLDHISGGLSGSLFPVGTTSVVWMATDASNNTRLCTFQITVNDVQAPSISCPAQQTRNTDPNLCTAVATYASPTVSDNCTPPTPAVSYQFSGATTSAWQPGTGSGSAFNKGITTVTLRATDAGGLTKTCTFRIIVLDAQAPAFSLCPTSQTLSTASNSCSSNPVIYATPTATDNCAPAPAVMRISGPASGSVFPTGTTAVIWRATDGAGRTALCSFSVTVTDNTAPVISCGAPIVVAGAGSPCGATVFYATPTASDNCSLASLFLQSGLVSGSNFPAGNTLNIWRATDTQGNTLTCAVSVTVNCAGVNNRPAAPSDARHRLAATAGDLHIVPNPADASVQLFLTGNAADSATAVTIYDGTGRLVWENRTLAPAALQVDVSQWASGLYVVALQRGGTFLTKRLVVSHR